MPNDRDLTPQTPGELPNVDQDRIGAIAEGTVDDVLAALDGLDALELDQLAAVEASGKARKTVIASIQREQARRLDGAPVETTDAIPPPKLGDADQYRDARGRDVDPAVLRRPVLTRDGWVIPTERGE